MLNDTLSSTLSKILNYESTGKKEVMITPVSKVIKRVLEVMKEHQYIGEYESLTDNRGGVFKIHLLGKVNKCGVIKPRFAAKVEEFEKFEKRFLPAQGVGLILISTSKGIMTLRDARKQNEGGKLLAYVY